VIFKGFDPGGMDVLPETVAVTIIAHIFLSLSKKWLTFDFISAPLRPFISGVSRDALGTCSLPQG
jgi:hypothetical protein